MDKKANPIICCTKNVQLRFKNFKQIESGGAEKHIKGKQ